MIQYHTEQFLSQVAMLAGTNGWYTMPVERLGILSLGMTDGPNGAFTGRFFEHGDIGDNGDIGDIGDIGDKCRSTRVPSPECHIAQSAKQQIASNSDHDHSQAEEYYAGPACPEHCQAWQYCTETAAKVVEGKVDECRCPLGGSCLLTQIEIYRRHGREHTQRQ